MITSPDRASAEWFTATLTRAGAAPSAARVEVVHAAEIGSGKVGRTVRFSLDWSPPLDGPATVVGKFPSADDRSRRTGLASGAYQRELLFYRHLAPGISAVPHAHLADLNPVSGEFALLLSDAAPARQRSQLLGASPDDAATALEELAWLQSRFWGTRGTARHRWLPVRGADGGHRMAAAYRLMAGQFLARFGDRLSPAAHDVVAGFDQRVRRWAAADRPPLTLLHGDFRLDNLLFGDGRVAAPLTVVDWQTVTVGPGPSDAAYLIGGALPVEVRRACEQDLYSLYLRSLRAAGVHVTDDECRRSYALNTLAGLHMTVVGAMLVGQDAASDAMFLSLAERHTAHATDLEAFNVLDHDR